MNDGKTEFVRQNISRAFIVADKVTRQILGEHIRTAGNIAGGGSRDKEGNYYFQIHVVNGKVLIQLNGDGSAVEYIKASYDEDEGVIHFWSGQTAQEMWDSANTSR